MRTLVAAAALVSSLSLGGSALAAEGPRAAFIDGVYAMEGRCAVWAALEAGGQRNIDTVPETLTADGFKSWEGGCIFESLTEKEKGRLYEGRMHCSEGLDEWTETDTFAVDAAARSITVTVEGKSSRFVKCDSKKGN